MSFDDHEVDNNWAGDLAEDTPPELFLLRRAAAFQAWYEHMPVRRARCRAGLTSSLTGASPSGISWSERARHAAFPLDQAVRRGHQ